VTVLVLRGRVVLPDQVAPADVTVVDGRIGSISEPGVSPADPGTTLVELAADEVLMPGAVDTHVHVNEPGRTAWEGFATATRAAAAGGVTTIIDMPLNSVPPTIDVAALELKEAATEGQCFVDVGLWGGAVPESLGALKALHDKGVFGFKCFTLHSGVDEFPPLDHAQLDAAMAEVARFDGLLVVHAEDAAVINHAPDCAGPSYDAFLSSRPPEAEDKAIVEMLELAGRHGTRVHLLHLSNAGSLDRLARAKERGVNVTVETCPHYLTLDSEHIADGATSFKCCPPIRGIANQERLWQGLADGVIDMVVSDHSPSTPDLKRLDTGDFGQAWGGVSSLQLGPALIWTAAADHGHSLVDVSNWMSQRPAQVADVPGKGGIAVGQDADLVVFAPDDTFVVDPLRLHHKNKLTPYAGRVLRGIVRQTWLRGERIATSGHVESHPTGALLHRGAQ
jgi:allantoinase